MFSRMRPGHRKTPSNPTSPADQAPSFEPPLHTDHAHPLRYQNDKRPISASATSPAPLLPPIPRVSSTNADLDLRGRTTEQNGGNQYWESSRGNTQPRDTYTATNHQRLPNGGTQRPESAGSAAPSNQTWQQTRSQTGFEVLNRPQTQDRSLPFVAAADLQNRPIQTGRRPNGTRLPSPPPSNFSTFEPQPARSGKVRNLLNPMSLLARRRTSQQTVAQLPPEPVSIRNRNKFSETFDPRIRGTVVHDFSAPRHPPKRNDGDISLRPFQRSPNPDTFSTDEANSPWGGGNHTPVFTEDFEEEQYPAAGPHVRKASDLTDLSLPNPPYAKGVPKSVDTSSGSQSIDVPKRQSLSVDTGAAIQPMPDRPPPVPPKSETQRLSIEKRRVSIDPESAPTKKASTIKGRPRNVSELSFNSAAIPRHMKSTSSRFSFDMIGAAEQERLLEDRHRQKALEKKANEDEDGPVEDEFEDDYDYDNMDDDDGLEERIPGVNADLDEEDIYGDEGFEEEPIPGANSEDEDDDVQEQTAHLAGFSFNQSSLPTPMTPHSPGMATTPRDGNGEIIGFAMTKNSPYVPAVLVHNEITAPTSPDIKESTNVPSPGLGIQGLSMPDVSSSMVQPPSQLDSLLNAFPRPTASDDDDLYFDDGVIDEADEPGETADFDESVFDNIDTDDYGRPVKSLSVFPPQYVVAVPSATNDPKSPLSPSVIPPQALVSKPSLLNHTGTQFSQPSAGSDLTEGSLAAYQLALAQAAHAAAASGKFRRESVQSTLAPSEQEGSHPGLITDSSQQTSHYGQEPFSPSYELEDDYNYDDELDDDDIIAAANAEVLADDCDGFYGQEFGFYSAPAASEGVYANGGYFVPRGTENLNRARSGRDKPREPNLTPITERSEYSNRNSYMSLNMYPTSANSVASPGLAQLAELMRSPDYEENMSLDALMKLRRGAWGGSQASGRGSPTIPAGGEEDSLGGHVPHWSVSSGGTGGNPSAGGYGHKRQHSGFSLPSENASENPSRSVSPTMVRDSFSPVIDTEDVNAEEKGDDWVEGSAKQRKERPKNHRHTGSTESISYQKEDDPVSGERWILERRRTAESGEVEILGREFISGGRI